ncbi:MAG TPA: DUF3159 domain-containing protein [Actinomycetota bacterium]
MSDEPEDTKKEQPDVGAMVRQMYGSKRAIIDTSVPPVLFVTTESFIGLGAAAAISAGYGVATAIYRATRKQETKQALFGLGGLGIALALALRTGRASSYFLPNVISGYVLALAAIVSVLVRRPLTALFAQALEGKPAEHYAERAIRNAHVVVTIVWGLWFTIRSSVRAVLIAQDRSEALGVTAIALGTPATVALVLASFWFLARRAGAKPEVAPTASDEAS